ncbi:hypothetical protein [Actinokineospora inagensis]|uniref:hypothetical protein n=1 Tax=Actinokineospora inagensis TaxID=103730 RepID=UPI00146FAEC1|nr:hypothetical protein [Actinokineospora inagensis]
MSGYDDQWSVQAEKALVAAGIKRRNAHFLSAHVEVRVAAMMIATGRKEMVVTIIISRARTTVPTSDARRRCRRAIR